MYSFNETHTTPAKNKLQEWWLCFKHKDICQHTHTHTHSLSLSHTSSAQTNTHILVDEDDVREPYFSSGDTQHVNIIMVFGVPRQSIVSPCLQSHKARISVR